MSRAQRKRKFEPDPGDLNQRGNNEHIAESWSKTEQYKVKGRHRWTIDNFVLRASCAEVNDSLCSPVFYVPVEPYHGEIQDLAFQLEIFLNNDEDEDNAEEGEDNSDCVAVFLTSRHHEDLDVKYDFSVQKADGTYWGGIGTTFKFSPDQNSWGYRNAFSKAQLIEKQNELLPGNKLTIVCNLEIYYVDRQVNGKNTSSNTKHQVKLTTPGLGDDLSSYATFDLNRTSFTDVSLVCGNRTFWCHKLILSARSDVFRAMFSHVDTEEGKTNKVEITDVEPDTLEQLLTFIYTDKLDETHLTTLSLDLLTAADKYNVPRLKATCERVICEKLDVSNAAHALVKAHHHGAKTLQKVANEFVTQNIDKVSESQGWNQIVSGHEALGEIIKSLMVRLKNN